MNNRNTNEDLPQITTRAFLKTNRHGGEILSFTIHLEHFHLICIANIPPEGETESSVYVKFAAYESQKRSDRQAEPRSDVEAA